MDGKGDLSQLLLLWEPWGEDLPQNLCRQSLATVSWGWQWGLPGSTPFLPVSCAVLVWAGREVMLLLELRAQKLPGGKSCSFPGQRSLS